MLTRVDFTDHHPLLVTLTNDSTRKFRYYFMFESARVLEENYHDVVNASWKNNLSLITNLKEFKRQASHWNKNTVHIIPK